ncbi:MAG: hypothetical protein U5K51_09105 [Flavobacteriaceae bacterium]|nr:hypothetical protein [Flavobacteriaceae bacterium]
MKEDTKSYYDIEKSSPGSRMKAKISQNKKEDVLWHFKLMCIEDSYKR